MYLIGLAIFVFSFIVTMQFKGASFIMLSNLTAIVAQVLAIVAILTATDSFKVFAGGFKAVVFPKKHVPEEVRGRAASLFRLLSKTTALVAVLVIIVSMIEVLGYLGDPERFGHGLSSALAAAIWALLLITAVFEPAVFILKKRQEERKPKVKNSN